MTPAEGLQISENLFVPGDTIVQVPTYTLQRGTYFTMSHVWLRSQADTISTDERNFELPNEFIPERWTSKPELVKNASVYSPFSIGKFYHACPFPPRNQTTACTFAPTDS